MKIYKGIENGYVCIDTENNFVQWQTFRRNRKDSWDALCRPEKRLEFKRMGFRCVYICFPWEAR